MASASWRNPLTRFQFHGPKRNEGKGGGCSAPSIVCSKFPIRPPICIFKFKTPRWNHSYKEQINNFAIKIHFILLGFLRDFLSHLTLSEMYFLLVELMGFLH